VLIKKERVMGMSILLPDHDGQQFLAQKIQESLAKADSLMQQAKQTIDDMEKGIEDMLLEKQLRLPKT
jgi:hypothetical protein